MICNGKYTLKKTDDYQGWCLPSMLLGLHDLANNRYPIIITDGITTDSHCSDLFMDLTYYRGKDCVLVTVSIAVIKQYHIGNLNKKGFMSS